MTYRPAVEVVSSAENQGLIMWHALGLVRPLSRNLDGCLDRLGASIHGQHHVVTKDGADLGGPDGEDIVMESAGAQS